MRLALAAYHCQPFPGWAAHWSKVDRLVGEAAADLVVLPEYAALEAALVGGSRCDTPIAWRDLAAERSGEWVEHWRMAAQTHGCHILAGSGPVVTDAGVVNRAWLISPNGEVAHQDKLILTPYERREMDMIPGSALSLFDTALGKIGVLICYDSEFPLLARTLVSAGADMILVPSCTDAPAGQTRVRQSCRARAIEGQCLIAQAPLVGAVPECELIDVSTGRTGVFCPPDYGLPPDGILAQGETDVAGVLVTEVDPAAIAAPRSSGQVANFAHWPEQEGWAGKVTTWPLV